jgi:NitT/TauT family transport system substrate-binding protein
MKIFKRMPLFLFLCCFGVFISSLSAGPAREEAPLRVGIMAGAEHSLPVMIAKDEGLFDREGIQVELVSFSNPQERDAAIQAGRLDGTISDLLAAAFLIAGGFDFKVTSLTDGRYGIIASPQSGVKSPGELRGKRIGLATNSIIQYTVDAQLGAAGVGMDEYTAVAVPRIPMRIQMALEGQIEAASVPEPLLTAAVAQGAVLVSTTETTGIDVAILLFTRQALDNRLEQIRAFYRAYHQAALRINADPGAYRDYVVEKADFPEAVKDIYRFITYRKPVLPDVTQVEQVLDWLRARELLDANLKAGDMLDNRAIAGN